MRIQINGWQRLGIILSALWLITVGCYAAYEYLKWPDATDYFVESSPESFVVKAPKEAQKPEVLPIIINKEDLGPCVVIHPKILLGKIMMAQFMPVAAVWTVSICIVWSVKWVQAGFNNAGETKELRAAGQEVGQPFGASNQRRLNTNMAIRFSLYAIWFVLWMFCLGSFKIWTDGKQKRVVKQIVNSSLQDRQRHADRWGLQYAAMQSGITILFMSGFIIITRKTKNK